jgi:hypothetical protein
MVAAVDQQQQEQRQDPPRKLKVLVISTEGSERQGYIRELFASTTTMSSHFETPVFSPSVSSRTLRNRVEFFKWVHEAGLIPDHEWAALQQYGTDESADSGQQMDPGKYFDCLNDVPVLEGRRGSQSDIKLHYCKEVSRERV